jgi:hypothetical protein
MRSTILPFDLFYKNLKENFEPEEAGRLAELGLVKLKKFQDVFSVLDFFGGSIPNTYESARMEAAQAGYELSDELYTEAGWMEEEGEPEDYGMYEATEAEVAQRKVALETEDAEIAQAEAALAQREAALKPTQPDIMTQKASIASEKAAISLRKAELAKKRDEVSKMQVSQTDTSS